MDTQQTKSYKKLQVETASPIGLVVMLYDRAIVLLNKAKKEIMKNSMKQKAIRWTRLVTLFLNF